MNIVETSRNLAAAVHEGDLDATAKLIASRESLLSKRDETPDVPSVSMAAYRLGEQALQTLRLLREQILREKHFISSNMAEPPRRSMIDHSA